MKSSTLNIRNADVDISFAFRDMTQRNDSTNDCSPEENNSVASNAGIKHAIQLRAALADTLVFQMNDSKASFDVGESQENGDERSREGVGSSEERLQGLHHQHHQHHQEHSSNCGSDEQKELAVAKKEQNSEDLLLMAERDDQTVIINIKRAGLLIAGEGNQFKFGNIGLPSLINSGAGLIFHKDDIVRAIIKNDPKLFPKALRRTGSCAGKRYNMIMAQTRNFQDSGLTEKLEVFSEKLLKGLKEKEDIDLQVVVMIQRTVAYIYLKDTKSLEKAKTELENIIKLAEKARNNQLLIGRCLQYLAYVATAQGKEYEALEYLDQASSIMALFVSGEDKAFISYLYGNVYLELAGRLKKPSAEFEMKAVEFFESDIKHVQEDEDKSLISKRIHFSTLKQITMLLRSYSFHSPQYSVPKEYLSRAKKLLDLFECKFWDEASAAAKVFFAAFRADYFARTGNMTRALDILNTEGIAATKKVAGVKPLVNLIKDRLKLYPQIVSMKRRPAAAVDTTLNAVEDVLKDHWP